MWFYIMRLAPCNLRCRGFLYLLPPSSWQQQPMCYVPLLAFEALMIKMHCKDTNCVEECRARCSDAYPNIDVTAMGFPKDWEMEPL